MLDYASTESVYSKLQLYLPRIFDFALDEIIFIAMISQVVVQMIAP